LSLLRPTLRPGSGAYLDYRATYFRVLQAVSRRRTLIHGRLEDEQGGTCAIGSYFRESAIALTTRAIDEIAAYNDSFPTASPQERWRRVRAWLRFQVRAMERGQRT
jgi:hypothetical protein